MALIFGGSSDSQSFPRSSRILKPLLDWLCPTMSPEARDHVVTLARKCCHLTEYGILSVLVWRGLRQPVRRDAHPWLWHTASIALLITAAYAATDEYHQTFVPGREGCLHDVIIDTCGGAAALLLLWFIGRKLKRW